MNVFGRNVCKEGHENEVVALCKTDQMLVCGECLKEHLKHNRVFTSTLAKNILVYAQEVTNTIEDSIQNFDCIKSSIDKEAAINSLKAKINEAFDNVISQLMDYKEKLLTEVENSEVLKEINRNAQELADQEKSLQDLQKEIETVKTEIERLLGEKNYIETIKMKQKLVQCSLGISALNKTINDHSARLEENIKQAENFGTINISSAIAIDEFITPNLLKELKTPKKPIRSPENLFNTTMTPEIEDTSFNQELANLLVKIDNTHGKEIALYNISSGAYNALRFTKDFKVPLNFAVIENKYESTLYITGGWLANKYRGNTYEYNLAAGKVVKKARMKVPRRSHVGVFCKKPIVCGGENSEGHLNSCEQFDILKNEWIQIPSLNEKKSYSSAVSLNEETVYVFGGYTYIQGIQKMFDTIECLKVEELGQWEVVKLVKKEGWGARQDIGAVQIGTNKILIFGGYADTLKKDSTIFDTETKTIEPTASLIEGDRFYQRTGKVINDSVYAMGGNAENIWVFDIKTKKWSRALN